MQAILDRLNANMSDTLPALDLSDYKAKLALLESSITINLQRIAAKIKEPTTIAALEDTDTILIEIGGLIDDINKAIKANNDVVNAKQTKQTECVDSVWEHLAFLLKDDVASYTTGIAALQAEIDDLNKKAKAMLTEGRALAGEISDLNKQVVNTKAAIDGINAKFGKGAIRVASTGAGDSRRDWQMRQELRTPHYTTRLEDIPIARA